MYLSFYPHGNNKPILPLFKFRKKIKDVDEMSGYFEHGVGSVGSDPKDDFIFAFKSLRDYIKFDGIYTFDLLQKDPNNSHFGFQAFNEKGELCINLTDGFASVKAIKILRAFDAKTNYHTLNTSAQDIERYKDWISYDLAPRGNYALIMPFRRIAYNRISRREYFEEFEVTETGFKHRLKPRRGMGLSMLPMAYQALPILLIDVSLFD